MLPKRDDFERSSSWSIHDVSPQARDLARAEAEREGLSVADWLARRITGEAPHAVPDQEEPLRQFGRLAESTPAAPRTEKTPEPRRAQPPSGKSHSVDEAMQAMQRLIESNRSAQEFAGLAMQNVVAELNGAARDQSALLDSLNARIDQIEGNSEALAQRNEEIGGRLGALAGGLETLGQTIATARQQCYDRLVGN